MNADEAGSEVKKHRGSLADYEATRDYFKTLVDVRFKLLALLPLATAGGISLVDLQAKEHSSARGPLSLFGLIISLALAIYDQRNTEIYDALKMRAKMLERTLGFAPTPIPFRRWRFLKPPNVRWKIGGAFLDRPLEIWFLSHTACLAIVYGAVIGAWVYALTNGCRVWAIGAAIGYVFYRSVLVYRPQDDRLDSDEEPRRNDEATAKSGV